MTKLEMLVHKWLGVKSEREEQPNQKAGPTSILQVFFFEAYAALFYDKGIPRLDDLIGWATENSTRK